MPPAQDRPSPPLLEISLPSLPQTLTPLLQGCRNPETPINELADLAARDLALSTKVLRLANSAFIGARTPFASVQQAIIYLGRDTLHSLTISIAVQEVFDKKMAMAVGISREAFWHHALLTALLAKDLAEQSGFPQSASCYLAGLLHDTGKVLLAYNYPEKFTERLVSDERLRLDWEKTHCGLDHAAAGVLLANHWHLPEVIGQAIALHHSLPEETFGRQDMAPIVYLANNLAHNWQKLHPPLLACAEKLGLDEQRLRESALRLSTEVQTFASTLGIGIPSAPPSREGRPAHAKEKFEQNLAPLGLLLGSLDNLSRAYDLERVLHVLEESLNTIFAIEQAVLLLPTGDPNRFIVRGSYRNRLARELIRAKATPPSMQRFLGSTDDTGLPKSWTRRSQTDEQENRFFSLFKRESLSVLPFVGSKQGCAFLVYDPGETMSRSGPERLQSLQLLLSHVGHRLQMEELQQQHAEALARERVAAIEEAARSLAHEICNPLAVVRNYLLFIEERKDLPAGLAPDLRAIGREVARIETISRQLNHLGRSRAQANLRPLHVTPLIEESVQTFTAMAMERQIALNWNSADNLPMICGDRQILEQALHNLISNAIEAVDSGGRVEVRCFAKKSDNCVVDEVTIEVTDNGPGLSAIAREKLFRPGYSTKGAGHAGLGLAIVKKLTADLGGRVEYRVPIGKGTTFRLHFPAQNSENECGSV